MSLCNADAPQIHPSGTRSVCVRVCVGGGLSASLNWKINRFDSAHNKLTSGYNLMMTQPLLRVLLSQLMLKAKCVHA